MIDSFNRDMLPALLRVRRPNPDLDRITAEGAPTSRNLRSFLSHVKRVCWDIVELFTLPYIRFCGPIRKSLITERRNPRIAVYVGIRFFMRTDLNNYWGSHRFSTVWNMFAESRLPDDEDSYARARSGLRFKFHGVGERY